MAGKPKATFLGFSFCQVLGTKKVPLVRGTRVILAGESKVGAIFYTLTVAASQCGCGRVGNPCSYGSVSILQLSELSDWGGRSCPGFLSPE